MKANVDGRITELWVKEKGVWDLGKIEVKLYSELYNFYPGKWRYSTCCYERLFLY